MWNLFSERGQPQGNDSSSDSLRQHRFAAQAQRECRRGRGDQSGSFRGGVNHDKNEFLNFINIKFYSFSICHFRNFYQNKLVAIFRFISSAFLQYGLIPCVCRYRPHIRFISLFDNAE